MIGWLSGQIIDQQHPGKLVIDVNGVGYDVETSLNTFFGLTSNKQPIGLHIHTVVREDALLLYGFIEKMERSLFRALIKVNGVGPKVAMAILSSTTPTEFIQCIQQGNSNYLTSLPGIGKKTAERLIMEMRDSLAQMNDGQISTTMVTSSSMTLSAAEEAISALETLGYKSNEARKAIQKLDDGSLNSEQLIRQGLQHLSGRA